MKEKTLEEMQQALKIVRQANGIENIASWLGTSNAKALYTVLDGFEKSMAIALQEGRNEGFAKGCELQKKVCAKYPLVCSETKEPASNQYVKNEYGGNEIFFVDKDSILNAPDAVNPYTK